MAMTNMNLIGAFETKLWHVQALACSGGGGVGVGVGGATKNIIPPKCSNFGDIITFITNTNYYSRVCIYCLLVHWQNSILYA